MLAAALLDFFENFLDSADRANSDDAAIGKKIGRLCR
jgi:hypothetical protein